MVSDFFFIFEWKSHLSLTNWISHSITNQRIHKLCNKTTIESTNSFMTDIWYNGIMVLTIYHKKPKSIYLMVNLGTQESCPRIWSNVCSLHIQYETRSQIHRRIFVAYFNWKVTQNCINSWQILNPKLWLSIRSTLSGSCCFPIFWVFIQSHF